MEKNSISIIIPVFNEAQSIPLLHNALTALYGELPKTEVLFIDDGSTDGSYEKLREVATHDPRVKVLSFARNYGQTAAIRAGIEHATGDILIPMDSDLENDPRDIPKLLAKIDEGYDVVSGWRQNRWKGQALSRKLPSALANRLISRISGVYLHDYGCTLKAYRKEVLDGVRLYGEMHRFIPAYASRHGARVTEIPVRYEARRFGKSNYGLSRTFRVLLDLLLLRFLDRYMDRPIHFFGGLGFVLLFLGGFFGTLALILRLFFGLHLVQTPLPVLTALLLIMGMNLIMMGVLGEMIMRTFYEVKKQEPYRIRETIHL